MNKLQMRDPDELAQVEARLVSIRDVQLATTTLPGAYNLAHLQAFHRVLFGDVYGWAGSLRTVDISKGGSRFGHWQFLDETVGSILARLKDSNYLLGLDLGSFVVALAEYYGDLNAAHPFREGNGRTVRAFLRQLAAAAGFNLDWSGLDPEDNIRACAENLRTADGSVLAEVLTPLVTRI